MKGWSVDQSPFCFLAPIARTMHKMMKVGQTEKKMSKRLWYDRDFSSYADIEWMNVELSGSNMAIATIL
jgi:hypothetical protein